MGCFREIVMSSEIACQAVALRKGWDISETISAEINYVATFTTAGRGLFETLEV